MSRRNSLPRISSPEGVRRRLEMRIATMPKDPKDGRAFRKPGSLNPRKAGR